MTQDVQTGLVAGTWTIDLSHSEVGFHGSPPDEQGARQLHRLLRHDHHRREPSSTPRSSVTIKSSSITTHNEQRDAHLRSADFFDPTKGGELAFVSTGITESATATSSPVT